MNPENGHAHLIYLLGAWVRTDFGDPSRLRVVRYAAAIERAYAAALGADQAYAGRFHHNPFSDAYVTKIGREAPYSLAELAQYIDLHTSPAKAVPPQGIGRNVEIFDRLRRWAYTAVADWKIGAVSSWERVVSERAAQIAADVGAESPRGPLSDNEVGHIVKSVARWVWERYSAGSPPLLREAQIAARRDRERVRQAAREARRQRSDQTRDEYLAPARKRRSEVSRLRLAGLSLRAIARVVSCSVAEVHRLLLSVQGSPAQSDLTGVCGNRQARGRRSLDRAPVLSPPPSGSSEDAGGVPFGVTAPQSDPTARSAEAAAPLVNRLVRGAREGTRDGGAAAVPRPGAQGVAQYEGVLGYIRRRICEIVEEIEEP